MAGFVDWLCGLVEKFVGWVKSLVARVVNFFQHVVGWFRGLNLVKGRDIAFVTKQDLKNARRSSGHGIYSNNVVTGVYNEQKDEITAIQEINYQDLDADTRNVMRDDKLVVLED